MSHFTSGCPYPHDQCKCYTARSWSPDSAQAEDPRCVNCGETHGPAVGGSESRVAPGQPADGERSAPPTDLVTAVAHAIRDIDGGYADDWSDCAQVAVDAVRSWDAMHAVSSERDDAIELLRQDVARLTRERNEWEANERDQYRTVLELRAELDRMQRMLGRAFPAWTGSEHDGGRP